MINKMICTLKKIILSINVIEDHNNLGNPSHQPLIKFDRYMLLVVATIKTKEIAHIIL